MSTIDQNQMISKTSAVYNDTIELNKNNAEDTIEPNKKPNNPYNAEDTIELSVVKDKQPEPMQTNITSVTKSTTLADLLKHTEGLSSILCDYLIDKYQLANDAALARFLETESPIISRIRHNKSYFSAHFITQIHFITGIPIRELITIQLYSRTEEQLKDHNYEPISVVIPTQEDMLKQCLKLANTKPISMNTKKLNDRINSMQKRLNELEAQKQALTNMYSGPQSNQNNENNENNQISNTAHNPFNIKPQQAQQTKGIKFQNSLMPAINVPTGQQKPQS